MDKIAEIAGKLSKAQRRLMHEAGESDYRMNRRQISSAKALQKLDLGRYLDTLDRHDPRPIYWNTHLGLAVRKHLNGE
jgi:hypothetical protein